VKGEKGEERGGRGGETLLDNALIVFSVSSTHHQEGGKEGRKLEDPEKKGGKKKRGKERGSFGLLIFSRSRSLIRVGEKGDNRG